MIDDLQFNVAFTVYRSTVKVLIHVNNFKNKISEKFNLRIAFFIFGVFKYTNMSTNTIFYGELFCEDTYTNGQPCQNKSYFKITNPKLKKQKKKQKLLSPNKADEQRATI